MRKFAIPLAVIIALLVVVLYSSVFIIKEYEQGLVLRLGEITQEEVPPGLHFKTPFISKVYAFDKRVRTLDSESQELIVLGNADISQNDTMPLEVDYYINWKIAETTKFYRRTSGDMRRAERLMSQRANKTLKDSFAGRNIQQVVSNTRSDLTSALSAEVSTYALEELGIEVQDVRVERIDFPKDIISNAYETMESAWEEQSQTIFANGKSEAIAIRAEAEKTAGVTKAEATGKAEEIKGQGEAEAAALYANAYSQDPEFYRFYRSLKAYRASLTNGDNVLVIKPDSDFFKYLNSSIGETAE